ncbi:MAG: peptidoglycan DD-metalloendopeptidase family protein [Pseudomonadota bacterium]
MKRQRRRPGRRAALIGAALATVVAAAALVMVQDPTEAPSPTVAEALPKESPAAEPPKAPVPQNSVVTRAISLPGQAQTADEAAETTAGSGPLLESTEAAVSEAPASAAASSLPPAPVATLAPATSDIPTAQPLLLAFDQQSHSPTPMKAVSESPAAVTTVAAPSPSQLTLTVQRGDSLDRLFRRHGLSVGDLHRMLRLDEAAQALRMVRPGDEITIQREGESVLALTRRLDDFRLLEVGRSQEGYKASVSVDAPERRVTHAHGRITSSLFNAGRAAGISDNLVMELAGIFAWDIDFVLDIRKGDEFLVLYEELWRDGQKLRDGAILAAEFVNTGDRYQALRYVDPEGRADYFTPDGLSLRKAFLRAPVDFSRISSNFNPNRRHPILNTIRAHRGVDYAAPAGTPIKAAGDGKVNFRGTKSGYGNTIILQHGDNITTLYAHLSRFASYKRGARVRQGDVIGYVGKTGLASGNHLHYEYRIAGVHRNPRTVKLPQADPIPEALRADFNAHAEHVLAQLQLVRNVRLATAASQAQVANRATH